MHFGVLRVALYLFAYGAIESYTAGIFGRRVGDGSLRERRQARLTNTAPIESGAQIAQAVLDSPLEDTLIIRASGMVVAPSPASYGPFAPCP